MLTEPVPEWRSLSNYRNDFVALVNELSKEKYGNCRVIGTFDIQVYCWWLFYRNGYSYVPDVSITTASDKEIESRLISFCRTIGMNPADFGSFIDRWYVVTYWLGHVKYQAFDGYTMFDISDYDGQAQEGIKKVFFLWCWNAVIPISEHERLESEYKNRDIKNIPKLDFVVLTNDESLKDFAPPKDSFIQTYKNSTFRVWMKKTLFF